MLGESKMLAKIGELFYTIVSFEKKSAFKKSLFPNFIIGSKAENVIIVYALVCNVVVVNIYFSPNKLYGS